MDLSSLPQELILEILAHLPAVDIIQCRRVCRRFLFAARDRYVWTSVFWRTEYPIADIDIASVPTAELEKILIKTEVMVMTYLEGTRRKQPRTTWITYPEIPGQVTRYAGLMGPYVVLCQIRTLEWTYSWYHKHDVRRPVYEFTHQVSERIKKSFLEASSTCVADDGMACIAYVQDNGCFDSFHGLPYLVVKRFKLKGGTVTPILKRTFSLSDVPLGEPWSFYNLSFSGGYVILYGGNGPLGISTHLFHINSGKTSILATQHSALSFYSEESFVSSSYLIKCTQDGPEPLQLPIIQEPAYSPSTIRLGNESLSLALPNQLLYECPNLIPRSPHTFVGVYIGDCIINSTPLITSGSSRVVGLHIDASKRRIYQAQSLMKLGSSNRDTKCKMIPCSPSSRSALGIVTVEDESHLRPVQYVIKLDFDGEGSTWPCRVTSTRMNVLAGIPLRGRAVEMNSFDPYTGRVAYDVWETGRPVGSPNGLLVLDFFPDNLG
ncbi:hypothetical protein NP233_g2594 [Leucocoprinus birnbaumii]|uniref:F-box domain-containing protein n=1 Tax=Leucocoprinus birnbaumii TaxID=56174 RepID=A0AAD5VZZ3_9AGAR|nr:hypothetical protein NP233_g2594 [Leucocoprinus birnbaumii]